MKKVSNPLSVIVVFCTLIETLGSFVLLKLPVQFQNTFMWFLMVLTIIIMALFFATWNFNSKVLYAPSDFKEDSSYLELIKIINNVREEVEEKIGDGEDSISIDELNRILESSLKKVEKETEDLRKILPKLLSQDGMSSTEIAAVLGKSQSSTRRILKKYTDDGTLKSSNQSGKTIYILNREKFNE